MRAYYQRALLLRFQPGRQQHRDTDMSDDIGFAKTKFPRIAFWLVSLLFLSTLAVLYVDMKLKGAQFPYMKTSPTYQKAYRSYSLLRVAFIFYIDDYM